MTITYGIEEHWKNIKEVLIMTLGVVISKEKTHEARDAWMEKSCDDV